MSDQISDSRRVRTSVLRCLPWVLLLGAGCSGGGGGGSDFSITSINVPPGATWKINRPIRVEFSSAVDFSTVSLNTINIRQNNGAPSTGEFYLEQPNVVVFQPRCPKLDDYSDAGLLPGGVKYDLTVLGVNQSSLLTVRSASGDSLTVGDARNFFTPISSSTTELFFDQQPLSPAPVIRAVGETTANATYIELGGDPNNRVYFERNLLGQITLNPNIQLPLNQLTDPESKVALMLFLNQPVGPQSTNITGSNLSWQFHNSALSTDWVPLATNLELVANCSQTGALVRMEPLGILPPDADLRVVIGPDFKDIVGETNSLAQEDFAPASTTVAPSPLVDQILEEFANNVNADETVSLGDPFAEWGNGALSPKFSFTGTGGPNGNFDWKLPAGASLIFSTNSQTITGGPNFSNQVNTTVIGGVLDVNNLRIEDGAILKVQGTNPFVILVAGDMQIDGEINISGTNAPGVTTLNTTNLPEVGSPGQAGGGKGGTGSPLTTASSPRGGNGFGAFNQPDGGGQGGETGWNNVGASQLNGRRGAGGGGGSFGANEYFYGNFNAAGFSDHIVNFGDWSQGYIGLDAEPGFNNEDINANGAITGVPGPFGGSAGPRPFFDTNAKNDFYGFGIDATAGNTIVKGELKKAWAGSGGGGGGDAAFVSGNGTFPEIPFKPNGDEKGAGGAGGAGSIHIRALGNIRFGPQGRIVCRGGSGGGGENTLFLNRIGGGSGGGSGGHVILEAGGVIDFSQSLGASSTAGVLAGGIIATGGEGGSGKADNGGAYVDNTGKHELSPTNDACPLTSLGAQYDALNTNTCADPVDGAGGDGGPGIIQLHVQNPSTDIILPTSGLLTEVCRPAPIGRFYFNSGTTAAPVKAEEGTNWRMKLVPSFGPRSIAQSGWIALGEGGFVFPNTHKDVEFDFGGTDTVTGLVNTTNELVDAEPEILTTTLGTSSTGPILQNPFTVVLPAATFPPTQAFLLHPPELLLRYVIELSNGSTTDLFNVVAASVDNATAPTKVTLTVDSNGPAMSPTYGAGSTLKLHPAYLRVTTGGTEDSLPDSATIKVLFQATTADALGLPEDPPPTNVFTPDIDTLNTLGNSDLRYLRFQVLFDIAAGSGNSLSPTSPIPSIDFLRVPFRYN